jgi:hypothetical protein
VINPVPYLPLGSTAGTAAAPAVRDHSALPENEDAVDAAGQPQRIVVPQGRRKQPVGYGLVRDRFEEAA